MFHSKNLHIRINKKNSNDLGYNEINLPECDRMDIVKCQYEFPENIIIQFDFSYEKIFKFLIEKKNIDLYSDNNNNKENKNKNRNKNIDIDIKKKEEEEEEEEGEKKEGKISNQEDNDYNLSLNEKEYNEKEKEEIKINISENKIAIKTMNSSLSLIENQIHLDNDFRNFDFTKTIKFNEITENHKFANLTLNALDYYPKNLKDFCMIFCPNCKERYLLYI
jgi:hypothetical protein